MTQKLSFDEILELLEQQESSPHHDVLVKWQGRYPDYKQELAQYFATWAIQEMNPDSSVIDEDQLAAAFKKRAMEMLRRQGRIVPKEKIDYLSRFEQLVLTAVYLLHGEGDIASITDKVSAMSGLKVSQRATSLALATMKEHFVVDSWVPDTEIAPEAAGTVYFTITMRGERALAHAKATSKVVADFLGDFA